MPVHHYVQNWLLSLVDVIDEEPLTVRGDSVEERARRRVGAVGSYLEQRLGIFRLVLVGLIRFRRQVVYADSSFSSLVASSLSRRRAEFTAHAACGAWA